MKALEASQSELEAKLNALEETAKAAAAPVVAEPAAEVTTAPMEIPSEETSAPATEETAAPAPAPATVLAPAPAAEEKEAEEKVKEPALQDDQKGKKNSLP